MPKYLRVFGLLMLAAGGIALAQTTTPLPVLTQVITTGMVGIANGQTARLNVLNPGGSSFPAQAACSAELDFLDAEGKVLKAQTFSLGSGKAASLDLLAANTVGLTGRSQIRAVVKYSSTPAVPQGQMPPVFPVRYFCTFVPTLEILDSDTNKTQVILTQTTFVQQATPIPLVTTPGRP